MRTTHKNRVLEICIEGGGRDGAPTVTVASDEELRETSVTLGVEMSPRQRRDGLADRFVLRGADEASFGYAAKRAEVLVEDCGTVEDLVAEANRFFMGSERLLRAERVQERGGDELPGA